MGDVEFTTARLAAMWSELFTSIGETASRAYATIPRTLNSTDLPAAIIFPGRLISRELVGSPRHVKETRNYDMALFIAMAALGDDSSSQIAVAPWFDRVADWFIARPGLELDGDSPQEQVTFDATLLNDNGYELLKYPTGGDKTGDFAAITQPIQVVTVYFVVMKG